jgi:hypothetical protein
MTTEQQVASIKMRLSKAEGDRDRWRAAGYQEKYLEAYFFVESLETELDRLVSQTPAENPMAPPLTVTSRR